MKKTDAQNTLLESITASKRGNPLCSFISNVVAEYACRDLPDEVSDNEIRKLLTNFTKYQKYILENCPEIVIESDPTNIFQQNIIEAKILEVIESAKA